MEKWVVMRKGAPFQEIAEKFHIQPIVARLIRNRDVIGDAAIERYLHGTINDLHDGMLMKDMDKAIDLLREKIYEGKKIRIIGDYDIDGINATYILLEALKLLGADVDVDIPDRVKDGYGLSEELIERAYSDKVDTILTCDNGIAAFAEISYAKQLGLTVIVTDHHEIPYEDNGDKRSYILPPADAVVDPKRQDCLYPFKGLCGAAVAYKVMEALFNVLGRHAEDIDYLMENVAIATVGDVMELVDENRIFVKQGLEMLKRTQNLGMRALIHCTGVDVTKLSAYHIGFVIGPCLNASGRLDTAKRALELLCAGTKKDADILAGMLKALNDNRKEMTIQAVVQAIEQIEKTDLKNDRVLVVYLPECHESLAGIVAGRVREHYYRPTIILTKAENCVKGSGRSIEQYNMYEELTKCKQLFTRFGGHQLAAGCSMDESNFEKLREQLNKNLSLSDMDFVEKVSIDMQLPFHYLTKELVEELSVLEPFGKGNAKPLFVEKDIEIIKGTKIGKEQNMLKLQVRDTYGNTIDALYFGDADKFLEYLSEKYNAITVGKMLEGQPTGMKLSFTYYPTLNEYMGRRFPQITIHHYQ